MSVMMQKPAPIVNVMLRSADLARFGPEIRQRCDAHPDLPTVILRGSHMTAHREMRFLVVAEEDHAEIARRIVHDVIDPEGDVEQLAVTGFEATGNTKSWHEVPEPVREGMRRAVRAILQEVRP